MTSHPTKRQDEIASFLRSEYRRLGMIPTQREIAKHFGFSSPNAVRSHLKLMETKGMLEIIPGKARGLRLKDSPPAGIPILGNIAAGQPIEAMQTSDEFLPVPPDLFRGSHLFALRVKGDSMKDVGILSGDLAVLNFQAEVANGEIAAVVWNEEATLKIFHRRKGSIVLKGANPTFQDITIPNDEGSSLKIIGKYVGLIRQQQGAA